MMRLHEPGGLVQSFSNKTPGSGKSFRQTYIVDASPLGEGRYSQVFGVTHRATKARRAVKMAQKLGPQNMIRDLGLECPGRLARHEAEILRRIDHPNIVRLYEIWEEEDAVHLVLELCEGGDVLERILVSEGRLPEREIGALFTQMLFATAHLHSQGIVHRDMKPEHFLFTRREPEREPLAPEAASMKLIDFGLSHVHDKAFKPDGGTPQFMAPEALHGRSPGNLTDRGDMWALGVVLHTMLVGHYPSPHLTDQMHKQYFAKPSWKHVSPQALNLLSLLMRQSPSSRPTSAEAMRHPWCIAAVNARMRVPEPMGDALVTSAEAYVAQSGLRRLALKATARELDDSEVTTLRRLFQLLSSRCDGPPTKPMLLRMSEGEDSVAELASAMYTTFDALDTKGSGTIGWLELVAAMLSAKGKTGNGTNDSPMPSITDDSYWRAFNVLSQTSPAVTASTLSRLLARAADASPGATSKADANPTVTLNRLVQEVFPSGSVCFSEFSRLVKGHVRGRSQGSGLVPSLVQSLKRWLQCCRCNSRASQSPDGEPSTTAPGAEPELESTSRFEQWRSLWPWSKKKPTFTTSL